MRDDVAAALLHQSGISSRCEWIADWLCPIWLTANW